MFRPKTAQVLLFVMVLGTVASTQQAKANDGGTERNRYIISWNFDLHIYNVHWGYAGPRAGYRSHVNWVIHYHPYGYWTNYGMRTQVNIHTSFTSRNCYYIWDSVSGKDGGYCVPDPPDPTQAVDALARASDEFARTRLHIYLPFIVYVWLAWAMVLCPK